MLPGTIEILHHGEGEKDHSGIISEEPGKEDQVEEFQHSLRFTVLKPKHPLPEAESGEGGWVLLGRGVAAPCSEASQVGGRMMSLLESFRFPVARPCVPNTQSWTHLPPA